MEEDDPVVKELDVFLAQELAPSLHLLQYPLRPPWRPYDVSKMAAAKIKPNQRKLQMEYKVDTLSPHHDVDSSIKLAATSLLSTSVSVSTNVGIALLRGDNLYITPVNGGIYQMRPSFAHLDAEDLEKRKAETEDDLLAHHDEEEEDEETAPAGPKSINVQFKRKESERATAARSQSHTFLKQLEDEEPWTELAFRTKTSSDSAQAFEKLMASSVTSVPFELGREAYLAHLHTPPPAPLGAPTVADAVVEGFDRESLRQLPLEEQLRTIYKDNLVFTYSAVKNLTSSSNDAQLHGALERWAVLVRGLWFLKPELHPLQAFYEHMLLLFHLHGVVPKKELGALEAPTKPLLMKVAGLKAAGWTLKMPPDLVYEQRHQDVAARAAALWNSRRAAIVAAAQAKLEAPAAGARRNSSSGLGSMPGVTPAAQLENFFLEVLARDGVCTMPRLRDLLAEARRSETNPYALLKGDVDQAMFLSVLQQVATSIKDVYVLKETGDASIDKFRSLAINLLRKSQTIKRSELNELAQTELHEPLPAAAWSKLSRELCVQQRGSWILKSGAPEG
jgi:DNA-directed RNA polymerase-3 subunit RPC5